MDLKMLVVDDQKSQRDEIVRAANLAGFADREIVAIEGQGAQLAANALAENARAQFDLAVVDLNFNPDDPENKDGIDLIRKIHSKNASMIIVALTTKRRNETGIEAMLAGAADFVSSKWMDVNWVELLSQKLEVWKGFIEGRPR